MILPNAPGVRIRRFPVRRWLITPDPSRSPYSVADNYRVHGAGMPRLIQTVYSTMTL